LAGALLVSRVKARTAKPGFFNMCRVTAPPCWPVAPLTNIFLVLIKWNLSYVFFAGGPLDSHN
jgi:hypothetical protein